MSKVSINPPKTPVTEGSNGVASATVPNVCKMPGPPAPFVPAPLPNIGRSGLSPKDYSKTVTIEGKRVAIKGATFRSMGDLASKATGGGIVSANTEGPTAFVGPGSMDVKIEGKNVQLLGDPMLNNCGPSGSPPNAATMFGVVQDGSLTAVQGDEVCPLCEKAHGAAGRLAESKATKDASDQLKAAADAAVAAASTQRANAIATGQATDTPGRQLKQAKMTTMLGVVICKDSKTYAAKSMQQVTQLQDAIPAGWHTPVATLSLLAKRPVGPGGPPRSAFESMVKDKQAFARVWNQRVVDHEAWAGADPNLPVEERGEPFYMPGQCAAQQALLLALEHQGRPLALTERWYKHGDPNAKVWVFFRTWPEATPQGGHFGGTAAVPPCGSCRSILPMLMCTEQREPKPWKPPAAKGVCRCHR